MGSNNDEFGAGAPESGISYAPSTDTQESGTSRGRTLSEIRGRAEFFEALEKDREKDVPGGSAIENRERSHCPARDGALLPEFRQ